MPHMLPEYLVRPTRCHEVRPPAVSESRAGWLVPDQHSGGKFGALPGQAHRRREADLLDPSTAVRPASHNSGGSAFPPVWTSRSGLARLQHAPTDSVSENYQCPNCVQLTPELRGVARIADVGLVPRPRTMPAHVKFCTYISSRLAAAKYMYKVSTSPSHSQSIGNFKICS